MFRNFVRNMKYLKSFKSLIYITISGLLKNLADADNAPVHHARETIQLLQRETPTSSLLVCGRQTSPYVNLVDCQIARFLASC